MKLLAIFVTGFIAAIILNAAGAPLWATFAVCLLLGAIIGGAE